MSRMQLMTIYKQLYTGSFVFHKSMHGCPVCIVYMQLWIVRSAFKLGITALVLHIAVFILTTKRTFFVSPSSNETMFPLT